MDDHLLMTRFAERMSQGAMILFTGSGFSMGALDCRGRPIPSSTQLRDEIWELTWPGEPVDDGASLRDTYAAALTEGRNRLAEFLRERLTVDPESVTESQRLWLSMPWKRVYTVNIDNLESAVQRVATLPRHIRSFSALPGRLPLEQSEDLLFVHLNGTIDDIPDTTFTDPQYGLRHRETSPLYEQLAADVLAYPVVFIGTQLHESLLWEYIALRDERGPRGVTEHRPGSYLITRDLPRDRQALLGSFNVQWVQATAKEFADEVLANLGDAADQGHRLIDSELGASRAGRIVLPSVSDLLAQPGPRTSEYLLGAQPVWADIQSGRAVEREFETGLRVEDLVGVLLVTGTAGAGTSTTLMRLGMRLSATGRDVRFVGADHSFTATDLSRHLRNEAQRLVVMVDDADTFGQRLRDLVNDVADDPQNSILLVLGVTASRIDQLLPDWEADGESRWEVSVPLLEDSDIELLLAALDSDNKLGALKPLDHEGRVSRVRDACGRELLVAMIEATSGEKFEVRPMREFEELEPEQKLIYGIVAIASEQRFPLLRHELLMASGDLSNTALNAIDRLASRKLLLTNRGGYVFRHRRLAELVVAGMRNTRQIAGPYRGLLRAMATTYDAGNRGARETKLLTTLMSHARVARNFSIEDARALYDDIEDLAKQDYHYWLQRGSLEVQHGNLKLARNWLQQAFAGGDHDHRVQTEWAYYLLKSAWKNPTAEDAAEKVREGAAILLDRISARGSEDQYPWHVYGSQMLAWIRRAPISADERVRELESLKRRIDQGAELFPRARDIRELQAEITQEWLLTAVKPAGR